MRDASTLGGDDASVALPLYATASNRSLLHQVTSLVEGLAAGGYKDKNSTTCSLLVGPAGSGKTNLLLGYLRACPILHPSVIPIYIRCDVLLHTGSSLAKTSLQGLMVAAAESHGVKVDRPQDLAGSLKRAGKQMLIVLDHMDQLYRCPLSEKELLHNVNATLGTVRYLGRQTSGCFGTILCSCETSTPQLQLLYADVGHLHEHLPMEAKGVPDPSRTQFRTSAIPTAICTDVAEVERIMCHSSSTHEIVPEAAERRRVSSLVTFLAGTIPRTLQTAMRTGRRRSASEDPAAYTFLAAKFHRASLAPDASAMYSLLRQLLLKENEALLAHCRTSTGGVNIDAVTDGSWVSLVRPVREHHLLETWEEGSTVARKRMPWPRHEVADRPRLQLLHEVLNTNLAMKAGAGHDAVLWPMSAAQLVMLNESTGDYGTRHEPAAWGALDDALALAADAADAARSESQVV